MKAVVIRGHGDRSQMALTEVDRPAIAGDRDVLVNIRAGALNRLDLWTLRGLPGISLTFPHVLGGDGAGIVADVGVGVHGVAPGDRVMINPGLSCHRCDYCLAGEHSLCVRYQLLGEHVPGTLAEYVVVPDVNLAPVPTLPMPNSEVGWPEAAAFSLVTLTAWRMLVTRARVRPGEVVLIWGIGGGVSVTALQVAKLAGAFVIATSSSDSKLERARTLGADVTLNHERTDVAKEVRAQTGKRGADVVVDNVGEATWELSLRALGKGGRLVSCGGTTGHRVVTDVRRLFWNQWSIMGSTMGNVSEYQEIVRLLSQGHLRPVLDSVYPFDDALAAFGRLESGEQMGKIAVEI